MVPTASADRSLLEPRLRGLVESLRDLRPLCRSEALLGLEVGLLLHGRGPRVEAHVHGLVTGRLREVLRNGELGPVEDVRGAALPLCLVPQGLRTAERGRDLLWLHLAGLGDARTEWVLLARGDLVHHG